MTFPHDPILEEMWALPAAEETEPVDPMEALWGDGPSTQKEGLPPDLAAMLFGESEGSAEE